MQRSQPTRFLLLVFWTTKLFCTILRPSWLLTCQVEGERGPLHDVKPGELLLVSSASTLRSEPTLNWACNVLVCPRMQPAQDA